jgi:hypothetical protein
VFTLSHGKILPLYFEGQLPRPRGQIGFPVLPIASWSLRKRGACEEQPIRLPKIAVPISAIA